MTTVLVTGATGTVGSNVVAELQQRGASVRAFARDRDKATSVLGSNVEIALGDLGDPDAVGIAVKGVDAVFLACGNHPLQLDYERNVIRAAVDEPSRRIVKLSALGAELGSPVAFWDCHARIEQRLAEADVHAAILQPAFLMSNLLAAAATISQAGQLFLPAGAAAVAMIDPHDVATAACALLTKPEQQGVYRLTGPAAITFDEVAKQLSDLIGRHIDYVDVPEEAARSQLIQAGVPEWVARNIVTVFARLRRGAAAMVTDDLDELIEREPRTFADFALDHARAFRS